MKCRIQMGVIKACRKGDRSPGKPVCLYTRDGKLLIGRHRNKASARRQERMIQWAKKRRAR